MQLTIGYAIPLYVDATVLANIENGVSNDFNMPVADVDATIYARYLTSVYILTPNVPPAVCDQALEIAFEATLCTQLAMPNCSYVIAECVKPGAPASMTRVPFFPTSTTPLIVNVSTAGTGTTSTTLIAATVKAAGGSPALAEATAEAVAAAAAKEQQPTQSQGEQHPAGGSAGASRRLWGLEGGANEAAGLERQAVRRGAQAVVSPDSVAMAVRFLMDNETDNAQFILSIFQKQINLLNWQVRCCAQCRGRSGAALRCEDSLVWLAWLRGYCKGKGSGLKRIVLTRTGVRLAISCLTFLTIPASFTRTAGGQPGARQREPGQQCGHCVAQPGRQRAPHPVRAGHAPQQRPGAGGGAARVQGGLGGRGLFWFCWAGCGGGRSG